MGGRGVLCQGVACAHDPEVKQNAQEVFTLRSTAATIGLRANRLYAALASYTILNSQYLFCSNSTRQASFVWERTSLAVWYVSVW